MTEPTPISEEPNLTREFARALRPVRRPTTLIERSLLRTGVTVDRAHLAAYQRLCGWPVSDLVPPTYPHLLAFPLQTRLMAGPDFPLRLPGMLHVRNEVRVLAPLTAGQEWTLTAGTARLAPHPKGRTVEVWARLAIGDDTVWSETSTYLARSEHPEPPAAGVEAPERPPAGPTRATARWDLPADLGRRYAVLSGDVNPIHLHPWSAKAMGFRRTVAHGMWTSARTLAALGPRVQGVGTHTVWFRKPVLLPSTVDLCRDDGDDRILAALRSGVAGPGERSEHLVLRWTPQG
ncbi:MaoC family dehydratase [Granulicoccus phenolivorans]|uniref:MaoC family dehydratase n=1 Tax=Granulicoccus phenolivorans TaxID=266854 RepID=UPI0003FA7748|nr:MaoC/PaaZ C-terminal domain-containing protein [Granulicoccus phenolivorans]